MHWGSRPVSPARGLRCYGPSTMRCFEIAEEETGMSETGLARQVLVVDDELDVQVMFQQRMRREVRAGIYQLFFAQSGLEALEVLRDNPGIRLILTDLNMPGMDGMELLGALDQSWPEVQSIVVSAYGDQERRDAARQRGAQGFVVKPVNFAELKEMLLSSLD